MFRITSLITAFISVSLIPLIVFGDDFYDLSRGNDQNEKLRYGRSGTSASPHGRVVGHIQKSTDPFKIIFGTKDLVYIRIKSSEEDKLQVGDRYIVDVGNNPNHGKTNITDFNSDESGHAGEVEIICVGEKTALGIILKANRSIISGVSVSRESKQTPGKLSSGDARNGHVNLISNF